MGHDSYNNPQDEGSVTADGADGGGACVPPSLLYSHKTLLQLRDSPLSSIKPAVIIKLEKNGCRCLRSVKKNKAPIYHTNKDTQPRNETERKPTTNAAASVKKPSDPRERLKTEEEGIVLSPQRRSFVSGCHAPSIKATDEETDKESGRGNKSVRRGGAGGGGGVGGSGGVGGGGACRLMSRDDPRQQGRMVPRYERYDCRLDKSDHRQDSRRQDDRRGGSREWQPHAGAGGGGGGGSFYRHKRGNGGMGSSSFALMDHQHHHHHRMPDRDSQPEWFSEGPTSQLEMIELCGFDPPRQQEQQNNAEKDEQDVKPASGSNTTNKTAAAAGRDDKLAPSSDGAFMDDPAIESTVVQHLPLRQPVDLLHQQQQQQQQHVTGDLDTLALDDILRLDLDSLPTGGGGGGGGALHGGGGAQSSRFSQWFRRRSPSPSTATSSTAATTATATMTSVFGSANKAGTLSLTVNTTTATAGGGAAAGGGSSSLFAPIAPAVGLSQPAAACGAADALLKRATPLTAGHPPPPPPSLASSSGPSVDSLVLVSKLANMASGLSARPVQAEPDRVRPAAAAASSSVAAAPRNDADALQRLMQQLRESDRPNSSQSPATINVTSSPSHPQSGTGHSMTAVLAQPTMPTHQTAAGTPAGANHMLHTQHQVAPPGVALRTAQHHQQQQHLQQQQQQQHLTPVAGASVTQENLLRLLHVQNQQQQQQHHHHQQQQQQQQQLMPAQAAAAAVGGGDQVLASADARAVMTALQAGRVTRQHLIQQLHTKNLPTRARDVLVAVLRLPQQHMPAAPSVLDPLMMTHHHQQQQQQQHQLQQQQQLPHVHMMPRTVSPLLLAHPHHQQQHPHHQQQHPHHQQQHPHHQQQPAGVVGGRRVPSPQEMRVHTQSLMHSALVKQKLEEQRDNYRRRQVEHRGVESSAAAAAAVQHEMQRHRAAVLASGGGGGGGSTSPSLAFTPTAVIRHMQCDSAAGQHIGSPEHRPTGRALVKTNAYGGSSSGGGGGGGSAADMAPVPGAWPPHHHHQQHHQQQQQQLAAAADAGSLSRFFGAQLVSGTVASPVLGASPRVFSVQDLEQQHRYT